MNKKNWKLGEAVRFNDGDLNIRGIVNGEPFRHESVSNRDAEAATYVPVHDPKRNRNLLVDSRNITGKDS